MSVFPVLAGISLKNAHDANLQVHACTLRPENAFLPASLKVAGPGDRDWSG